MGGYFSRKDSKSDSENTSQSTSTDSSSEGGKKSRYTVVYADREVKVSDLPRDLRALFVLKRRGSMYMDEDGQFAHEFYREKRVTTKKGVVRWIMEKTSSNLLIPQGDVNHTHPRLHADFPLVLLKANAILVPRSD